MPLKIENSLRILRRRVQGAKASTAAVVDDITTLESSISALESDIEAILLDIEGLSDDIADHETRITALEPP